ncbi:MAG TPA: GrpB family protein [Herpetosiphonaceae bacterium]
MSQPNGSQPSATVAVVPHDPAWASAFRAAAEPIAAALAPELVAIHHAGSTSIPGIKAKPTIDILIEARQIDAIDAHDGAMSELGYAPRGELGIAGRRYFTKTSDMARTHNVHVFQTGHPEIERMLNLRDYLRAHPDAAEAYSRLKEQLARQFPGDIESYTLGKSEFIEAIVVKARAWREERTYSSL